MEGRGKTGERVIELPGGAGAGAWAGAGTGAATISLLRVNLSARRRW